MPTQEQPQGKSLTAGDFLSSLVVISDCDTKRFDSCSLRPYCALSVQFPLVRSCLSPRNSHLVRSSTTSISCGDKRSCSMRTWPRCTEWKPAHSRKRSSGTLDVFQTVSCSSFRRGRPPICDQKLRPHQKETLDISHLHLPNMEWSCFHTC